MEINKTYKGMINVDRYFKACPDGVGYEFQAQLTDHLLTEILRANDIIIELDDEYCRAIAQYKAVVKQNKELQAELNKIKNGATEQDSCWIDMQSPFPFFSPIQKQKLK